MLSIIFKTIVFFKFDSNLYKQSGGISMRTNCAPLVADLVLFCNERDFMLSLSDKIKLILLKLLTPDI